MYATQEELLTLGDIRESAAVDDFVDQVLKEFGQIDILINNAGGQFPINAESLTSKGFEGTRRKRRAHFSSGYSQQFVRYLEYDKGGGN